VDVNEILNDPYLNATLAQEWATNIFTWGKYLVLLIFPHPLTHDYYPWHIGLKTWGDAGPGLALLAYAVMVFFGMYGFRKKKLWAFAILFFLTSFSISSNVVFNIGTLMNERFMFVPSLGFGIIIAMFLTDYFRKKGRSPIAARGLMIAAVLLLSLYSVKTFTRNFAWENDFSLFTTDVKTSKNSTKCNVSAGGVLLAKAQEAKTPEAKAPLLNQAEQYLRKAIDIYPGNFAGWVLLGNVYLERKDYVNAKDCYIRCLNINNKLPEGLNKLAFVGYKLENEGNHTASLEAFLALSNLQPEERSHTIQIVDAYSKTGKVDTAMVILNKLLANDSSFAGAWSKLGEIHGRIYNNIDLAERYLNKAYSLDSTSLTTLENLGIVKGLKKEFPQSVGLLKRALALDSLNPRIMNNIASTYYMMGDKPEAESWSRKATEATQKNKK
jgi:tetratricopeptide (TPR) repeat protein